MSTENRNIVQAYHEVHPVEEYSRFGKAVRQHEFKKIFNIPYTSTKAEDTVAQKLDNLRALVDNPPEALTERIITDLISAEQTALKFGFKTETEQEQSDK